MNNYIRLFIFVIILILIFLLFYRLYRKARKIHQAGMPKSAKNSDNQDDNRVKPRSCPICSSALTGGDQVHTTAFPALGGSKDRLMHIRGCINCIAGDEKRICPVCGGEIPVDGYLISRIFDRPMRRSHVHVMGCSQCKKSSYNKKNNY